MMVKTITVAELKKKLERCDDNAIITVDNCHLFKDGSYLVTRVNKHPELNIVEIYTDYEKTIGDL